MTQSSSTFRRLVIERCRLHLTEIHNEYYMSGHQLVLKTTYRCPCRDQPPSPRPENPQLRSWTFSFFNVPREEIANLE